MCDILKPHEQVPAVQALPSSPELVSAGAEATASVAAILDTHVYGESSGQASSDEVSEPSH